MKRVSTSTALALLAAMATGCGGASPATRRTASKDKTSEVRTPVKAGAVKEFEAGLRAQRLGGADSNAKAKAKFEAALAIDGTLWEAWHNIGYLAVDGGDDAAAVVAFGKALAINGDNTSSRLARAEAERRLGKVGDARADYQAVLANADDDDTLRRDAAARMASLLRDAGKFEEAIEGLRDVIRTSGASARIYTELGMIYIEQKRFELAALVLAKAVELDAKEPAAYNALALLALRQAKLKRRLIALTMPLRSIPNTLMHGSTKPPYCLMLATMHAQKWNSTKFWKNVPMISAPWLR